MIELLQNNKEFKELLFLRFDQTFHLYPYAYVLEDDRWIDLLYSKKFYKRIEELIEDGKIIIKSEFVLFENIKQDAIFCYLNLEDPKLFISINKKIIEFLPYTKIKELILSSDLDKNLNINNYYQYMIYNFINIYNICKERERKIMEDYIKNKKIEWKEEAIKNNKSNWTGKDIEITNTKLLEKEIKKDYEQLIEENKKNAKELLVKYIESNKYFYHNIFKKLPLEIQKKISGKTIHCIFENNDYYLKINDERIEISEYVDFESFTESMNILFREKENKINVDLISKTNILEYGKLPDFLSDINSITNALFNKLLDNSISMIERNKIFLLFLSDFNKTDDIIKNIKNDERYNLLDASLKKSFCIMFNIDYIKNDL